MHITKDSVVSIDFTLTDNEGTEIDSTTGQDPLVYLHGHGSLLPAIEEALEGKAVGDNISLTLDPAAAYGVRDEAQVSMMPLSALPEDEEIVVGMQFHAEDEGSQRLVTITKIEGDQVTIDGNHPLAGQTLSFEIAVADLRPATTEELTHGHVHGPGGAH
jgi:FKBP-type peptidyl-prolyl cis-trans isomerase SlyD